MNCHTQYFIWEKYAYFCGIFIKIILYTQNVQPKVHLDVVIREGSKVWIFTYRNEEEDKSPIAPYPPLCFRLNSRPPPGHLYYFSYGLNMNHDR